MDYYLSVLKKYAEFSGRASRAEYWYFVLFNFIISVVIGYISGFLSIIYALGVFLPSLAVAARRLHDTNRSAWWLLIALVPLLGVIVLLVFMVLESDSGKNNYGDKPKNKK
ncbi:DUF805 domain-containing protein [Candidatus Peregrinibacteria bacterium]|jgi:uncharacterized membrane protein YhaH (DUF805 family)|nr:DUF805 domain-containing protein [Candidatus Peregrinibacteria bacterium]